MQFTGNGTTKTQNFTGQKPPHESNGLVSLVVARNSNIDKPGWGINIGERNDGDIGIGCLGNGLMISSRVSYYQKTRFLECRLDLIGQGTCKKKKRFLVFIAKVFAYH